ncbi:MAG: 2-oxoglutarate dehydrogenase complex dihydrolipoyllysine-residue succinyltransferase [Gemmatimonadaceae bacterium]|nr:2-oxoglutarate dehydrogenase complex dihydrolipoyllysine-residue succinyltransferase [Gemmatimonadaceae bacterium]MDQ3244563.1 2-oxoglutarate dehydrogenase complex dihydrolipoyllysine-residue succinyltransferase [Gemmatimonadota bacterium]
MLSIKVPPLGESIVEATVSRWLKKQGEAVAGGDTIVELETDKITVEVPAPRAGVLSSLSVAEGDVVKVDQLLAELDEAAGSVAGASVDASPSPAYARPGAAESEKSVAGAAQAGSGDASTSAPTSASKAGSGGPDTATSSTDVKSSPAARRVAAEAGVDVAGVKGTGRGGVVSKPDVVEHVAKDAQEQKSVGQPASTDATPGAPSRSDAAPKPSFVNAPSSNGERETREKMTTRRKRIAENLLQSQHSTAHLTTFNEIDMSAVNALREKMKERVEKEHGVKLTFMPFFVKAACMALEGFPVVNAQIDADSIIYKHYVNMGIAVTSDAGLVVPNIKDAHRKGVLELSRDIAAVAKRARDGKLSMDDLTGGTFTITNGGVFGSLVSTPIINYPQVGILGLHKTQDRPIAMNGQVVIRPMMYVALSYDHRIVDGQQAVLFLVRAKELLEDPATMLIS